MVVVVAEDEVVEAVDELDGVDALVVLVLVADEDSALVVVFDVDLEAVEEDAWVAGFVGERYCVLTHAVLPFECLKSIFVNLGPVSCKYTVTAWPYFSLPTTEEFADGVYRTFTPDLAVQ